MMRFIIHTFLFVIVSSAALSNNDTLKTKNRKLYFSWGYTRAAFSKSTIHFEDHSNTYHEKTGKNNYYDFTIYDAKAKDRPDFDKIYDVINITIPQYCFRIGYYFNKNTGFELNFDHTKYVVTNYQRVHIQGQFNGDYVDKDTTLDPSTFLHFEHTDGANFWMINFVKTINLYNKSPKLNISWVLKPGAGIVYPRTDVTLFGEKLNNRWHLAGWIVGAETGLHVEFIKHGLFEFTTKGSYADYMQCLVLGKGNGVAKHSFFTGQLTATIGLMFGM